MRAYFLFFLVLGASALAQTTNTESRRFDLNGNPIPAGASSESKTQGDGRTVRTEYGLDSNGQKIPLSSTEETKVEQGGRTVVQQVIRRFDQDGKQTSSERVVSEETKLASGVVDKKTSIYRSDLNGNENLDERAVTRTEGKTTVTNVEKRAFDGTLALAERQTTTTDKNPNGEKSESSTFRKDNNGNLYEVVKQLHESKKQGNQAVDNDSTYVVQGDGRFALQVQTVTRSATKPDGTVNKRIEVYGEQVPGTTNESGAPALKEIQIVEARKGADGTIVETTTSQKAEVTDNGRLTSPPQVISETVIAKKPNQ